MKNLFILLLIIISFTSCMTDKEVMILKAEDLVKEKLISPESAKIITSEIAGHYQDKYYAVKVIVDSKNAFGVIIRNNFLVAISQDEKNISYDPNNAVHLCSSNPSDEDMRKLGRLNNWPGSK
jgi:hypothetical protein